MEDDDIVKMELNTKYGYIKYFINNIDKGIAYRNIDFDKNMKYRLCLWSDASHEDAQDGVGIKLLEFSTQLDRD